MNSKKTSDEMSSLAAKILNDQTASEIQRTLAGSVLSQSNTDHQTSSTMEDIASRVLSSDKYNETTKSLAGSVLSQAERDR